MLVRPAKATTQESSHGRAKAAAASGMDTTKVEAAGDGATTADVTSRPVGGARCRALSRRSTQALCLRARNTGNPTEAARAAKVVDSASADSVCSCTQFASTSTRLHGVGGGVVVFQEPGRSDGKR